MSATREALKLLARWEAKSQRTAFTETEEYRNCAYAMCARELREALEADSDGWIAAADSVRELISAIESVQDWGGTYVGECIDAVEACMNRQTTDNQQ